MQWSQGIIETSNARGKTHPVNKEYTSEELRIDTAKVLYNLKRISSPAV